MTTYNNISSLEPKEVWSSFVALNAIPRPSKKEEKVMAFILDFGASLGLETLQDTVGNILIRKQATKGMEQSSCVTLQAHLDMVHQKNDDTVFDFETQGIQMEVIGDWVKAKGTTLGADNGMGVAAIMAVLKSVDIKHGPLEALFTIDEETGMTGAKGLSSGWLQGRYLLNLDTEEDDEISIGCAGGIDITAVAAFELSPQLSAVQMFEIKLSGLQGGHSGMDIHRGFGNANLIVNDLLLSFIDRFDIQLHSIKGGSLRNAIPRESVVQFLVPTAQLDSFRAFAEVHIHQSIKQWSEKEQNLVIDLHKVLDQKPPGITFLALSVTDTKLLCVQIKEVHNGVYTMNALVPNLVETSNNLAKVNLVAGKFQIECLCRSSVERAKMDLANKIRDTFDTAIFEVMFSGDYPGWEPKPEGALLSLFKKKYEEIFQESPRIVACHAGLECGLLGKPYPEMEMISFGPTIRGAHSPDEKVNIPSVQKFWRYFIAILKVIK
jgi:dipeptidase D